MLECRREGFGSQREKHYYDALNLTILHERFLARTNDAFWLEQYHDTQSLLEREDDSGIYDRFFEEVRNDIAAAQQSSLEEIEDPPLALLHIFEQYQILPVSIRLRGSWQVLAKRLSEDNSAKFALVNAMRGGGLLFGIDIKGRFLFKDKGPAPIQYRKKRDGSVKDLRFIKQDEAQEYSSWADFDNVRNTVLMEGYALFPAEFTKISSIGKRSIHNSSDEIDQVYANTGEPFIECERGQSMDIWLETKDSSIGCNCIMKMPNGMTQIGFDDKMGGQSRGVARLLRV